jgi:hypothetical protein
VCLSAGRTKATLVEPVTPNTQNMTAASVRFSRQCGLCCSVQSQNGLNRDADGGGGGGVLVHSNRTNGGRCGWTAVGRRLKAQNGRRASCIGLNIPTPGAEGSQDGALARGKSEQIASPVVLHTSETRDRRWRYSMCRPSWPSRRITLSYLILSSDRLDRYLSIYLSILSS